MSKIKAVGFVSGGLDSIVSVELMKRQDIDIVAYHIINGFGQSTLRMRADVDIDESGWLAEEQKRLKEILGVEVHIIDMSEEFIEIVKSPRYGYGRNMNPCIDCKIAFFRKGYELIRREQADFVFTGEVLGQRPMSQNRRMMDLIEKKSLLGGLILRPLSAKLLPETIPERKGWVDRNKLMDIQGRSRKRQIALAAEFGVKEYPNPAGGCILTDENYSARLKDLLEVEGGSGFSIKEAVLLSVGRHFRFSSSLKIVVGRNESENDYLEEVWKDSWLVRMKEFAGPTVLLRGVAERDDLERAGAIAARYSKARDLEKVDVIAGRPDSNIEMTVNPALGKNLEDKLV